MKPLELSFPHPFLVNNIAATLEAEIHTIFVVLKKALLEPWPCDFQPNEGSKLVANSLKLWEEKVGRNSLQTHLTLHHFKRDCKSGLSALDLVRINIQSIFCHHNDFFSIQLAGLQTTLQSSIYDSHLLIRIHRPVRTTRKGTPVLLVSAYDNEKAKILAKKGKWDNEHSAGEHFFSKFPDYQIRETVTILTESAEGLQLWRYILRLNSARIVPTTWQKKNLLLDGKCPWLATFIAPLYKECRVHIPSPRDVTITSEAIAVEKPMDCCALCQKCSPNLKRCGRCQSIVYCNVECQRAHWPQHKTNCTK